MDAVVTSVSAQPPRCRMASGCAIRTVRAAASAVRRFRVCRSRHRRRAGNPRSPPALTTQQVGFPNTTNGVFQTQSEE